MSTTSPSSYNSLAKGTGTRVYPHWTPTLPSTYSLARKKAATAKKVNQFASKKEGSYQRLRWINLENGDNKHDEFSIIFRLERSLTVIRSYEQTKQSFLE